MEMGNVSNRQQPDHRTDNCRRSPIGLQCSDKRPYSTLKRLSNEQVFLDTKHFLNLGIYTTLANFWVLDALQLCTCLA